MRAKEHHGMARTHIYRIWSRNTHYGQPVCEAWKNSFVAFTRDMGRQVPKGKVLTRLDKTQPFCKENCVWEKRHGYGRKQNRTYRQWVQIHTDYKKELPKHWYLFQGFLTDMGWSPRNRPHLVRLNQNTPYSKKNCQWVSKTEFEQSYHKKLRITCDGKTLSITEWAKKLGLCRQGFVYRLNHMSQHDACTKPHRDKNTSARTKKAS